MKAFSLTTAQQAEVKSLQSAADAAKKSHLAASQTLTAFYRTIAGANKFRQASITDDGATLVIQ